MEKVYGVYPGNLSNLDEIKKLTESELFMVISSLENYLLQYKRIAVRNASRCFDISEDEYALEFLIGKTAGFGVELEKDENGKVIRTGDYASWCEFHMKNFESSMDFKKFLDLKAKGYNVSRYIPNSSYLEYKKRVEEVQRKQIIKIPQKNV